MCACEFMFVISPFCDLFEKREKEFQYLILLIYIYAV